MTDNNIIIIAAAVLTIPAAAVTAVMIQLAWIKIQNLILDKYLK